MENFVQRFLFDDLDIRGALVRLGPAWQAMRHGRDYPEPVATLLGEMTAVATLIGGQLKQAGRLTFQVQGAGPVRLLVVDCNEQLEIRGMAIAAEEATADDLHGNAAELLGADAGGRLALLLELPHAREPYQSIVPLVGESVAQIFEHYLVQSEQQPTRLILAASEDAVAGLFLQKLPNADLRDIDGWDRVVQLASTVRDEELFGLSPEELLLRLFHEETVRLFDAQEVTYYCPEDWDKVREMLKNLGQEEVEAILAEQGEVVILDDICNHEYRFDAESVAELFAPDQRPPTLH
jgi:molecular chaperone Hsp33